LRRESANPTKPEAASRTGALKKRPEGKKKKKTLDNPEGAGV
jgi:hypothetical protein